MITRGSTPLREQQLRARMRGHGSARVELPLGRTARCQALDLLGCPVLSQCVDADFRQWNGAPRPSSDRAVSQAPSQTLRPDAENEPAGSKCLERGAFPQPGQYRTIGQRKSPRALHEGLSSLISGVVVRQPRDSIISEPHGEIQCVTHIYCCPPPEKAGGVQSRPVAYFALMPQHGNRALAQWRQARAVELAVNGLTYVAIAAEVGFTHTAAPPTEQSNVH